MKKSIQNEQPDTLTVIKDHAREMATRHRKIVRVYQEQKSQCYWIRCDPIEKISLDDPDLGTIELKQVWAVFPTEIFDTLPNVGTWTIERTDEADWPEIRTQYMGKRTITTFGPVLTVEGLHFAIVE